MSKPNHTDMADALLNQFFAAALNAAGPDGNYQELPAPPENGRTIVLAAGKGAARMAASFETAWQAHSGKLPDIGLAVTRYDHGCPTQITEIVEAAHPVPDAAGQAGAARLMELAQSATADDLLVFLISGGASALLAAPAAGVRLEDKAALGKALLASGAPIDEMNRVRQAFSAIKGGRLAALGYPARMVTYAISDVPGDAAAVIGSGPTVPLPTGEAPADILARRNVDLPPDMAKAMASNPSPDPQHPAFDAPFHLVATPQLALEAAAEAARQVGITPMILGDAIEGEAREVARVMAAIARQVERHGQPLARPCVLLSGGETTVTVKGNGRGGRNAEFLLALAIEGGFDGFHAIACDTDGIDGIESNAGAIIRPDTIARAEAMGLHPRAMLDNNDGFSFFQALGDLVTTGPTRTNVNDFRAILLL